MIIHTIIDPLDIFYEEPKQPEGAKLRIVFYRSLFFSSERRVLQKLYSKGRNELFIACKKSYVRQYGPPLPGSGYGGTY